MNANPGPRDSSAAHNPTPQGEKRKRDGEQPPHAAEISRSTGSLTRERVVEILSNTANGCLSELGYYPGMAGRLKELEAQNLKWRDENVKLYEDNQRLTQMVQNLNANVALSATPESDKTAQIRQLHLENAHTRKEYEKLVTKYNLLLQSFQIVSQENKHLKHLQGLAMQSRLPQQPLQQVQQASHVSSIHTSVPQHNGHHPQQQAHIQQSAVPRPSSAQSFQRGPNQIHQNELTQTQFAVVQHRQHSTSNPSSRRTSLNFVSPTIQSPQVPSQPYTPTFPPPPSQTQYHPLDGNRQVLPVGAHYNMRRASAPNTPTLHGNPHPFTPPPRIHSGSVEPGSLQPIGPTQVSQMPAVSIPNAPTGNPVIGHGPFDKAAHIPRDNPTSQNQQSTGPKVVAPITPQAPYVSPPSMVQPKSTSLVSPQPVPVQNDTPPQPLQSMYIPSPSASTPFPQPATFMAPSNSLSSSTPEDGLITENDDPPTTEPHQLDETTTSGSVDGAVALPTSAEVDAMQVDTGDEEEEEEEEEEEVELGPDGLRLVKDCLIHIFGVAVDGQVTCKLCEHRFKGGFQDQPPIPFIYATDDELEKHCLEEHQKPWEALRNPEIDISHKN